MSVTGDVLALLRLIESWSASIQQVTALIQKMRQEGRETLTDEEKAELRGADDAARAELVAAIEAAAERSDG